jgi:hypothetical protein
MGEFIRLLGFRVKFKIICISRPQNCTIRKTITDRKGIIFWAQDTYWKRVIWQQLYSHGRWSVESLLLHLLLWNQKLYFCSQALCAGFCADFQRHGILNSQFGYLFLFSVWQNEMVVYTYLFGWLLYPSLTLICHVITKNLAMGLGPLELYIFLKVFQLISR